MKVIIPSSFLPVEGIYLFKKIRLETAKEILKKVDSVLVATQHETVKILGLDPAKDRINLTENDLEGTVQLWIKPNKRLEFGREYSVEEIENIGYTIYCAIPWIDR